MTFDAFVEWLGSQPESPRYELVAGIPVAMAPERAAHARMKARVWAALRDAIAERGLPCEAFADGMAVPIDDTTAYEPDAVVQCGERVPDDATALPSPSIVIEVLSPSTRGRDTGAKLDDYFRLPSVQHYLLIKTERRSIIQHSRRDTGDIVTRIWQEGRIELDPPGIALEFDALYA